MKSVILGGTRNLGKYVSEKLESLGYDIITVSRSNMGLRESSNHFQCDVSDNNQLIQILDNIKKENGVIDNLWCVAGYAHLAKIEDQTPDVVKKNFDRNFNYVKTALEMLKDNLRKGTNPFVITFGSQWSYKFPIECPELIPYSNAKKALMNYTPKFALNNALIRANHYCMPTTDTATYREIERTLNEMNDKKLVVSHGIPADPVIVVNALVTHALNFKETGKTLLVGPDGLVGLLN
jgi:NAD(P)-dependent dehydrogenase (short-subunit alcohol dehydrogenase family)